MPPNKNTQANVAAPTQYTLGIPEAVNAQDEFEDREVQTIEEVETGFGWGKGA
jgi:hypothetical protein